MSAATAPVSADTAARQASLKQRILSGLVLAAVAMAAVWAGFPYFEGLVLVAAVLAALEWRQLCGLTEHWTGWAVVAIGAAAVPLAVVLGDGTALLVVVSAGVIATAASRAARTPGVYAGIGIMYLAAPAVASVFLRGSLPDGAYQVFWVIGVVAATDIGAFAGGRTIGGPRLAPRTSPGKTWSGAIAGGLAGGLAGLLIAWLLHDALHVTDAVLAIAISATAQIGDLFESAVKRRHKQKDSGTLIPGHGGVLDRIDGLLFAIPAFALLSWLGLSPIS